MRSMPLAVAAFTLLGAGGGVAAQSRLTQMDGKIYCAHSNYPQWPLNIRGQGIA